MALTLWRGEHLLGELRGGLPNDGEPPSRPGKPPAWAGILIPAPGVSLVGVWQVHVPMRGFDIVQHLPMPPRLGTERTRAGSERHGSAESSVLDSLTSSAMQGVPREMQLTVRDAAGHTYLPLQLNLDEVPHGSMGHDRIPAEIPAEALVDGCVWMVTVMFQSAADAPAT